MRESTSVIDRADATVEAGAQAVNAPGDTLPASFWREHLAPYATPSVSRGLRDLATSALPYVLLIAAMYVLLQFSDLLVLALAVPAAGFLLRTFIVFHDCAHGSFLPSRSANNYVGIACGFLVFSPFGSWRHEHAVHHATAGDLDHRGKGDVETLTVAEYLARSDRGRFVYRLLRNPLAMLLLGPLWALRSRPVRGADRARPLDFDLIHHLRRLNGLPGHPDVAATPEVVTSTGSLGMGISKARGFVLADRLAGRSGNVYVLTGDGELQEGQFWSRCSRPPTVACTRSP